MAQPWHNIQQAWVFMILHWKLVITFCTVFLLLQATGEGKPVFIVSFKGTYLSRGSKCGNIVTFSTKRTAVNNSLSKPTIWFQWTWVSWTVLVESGPHGWSCTRHIARTVDLKPKWWSMFVDWWCWEHWADGFAASEDQREEEQHFLPPCGSSLPPGTFS